MEQMKQITAQGRQIEESSFDIIDREIAQDHGGHSFSEEEWGVVRRAIHTTGDFEFARLFRFSSNSIKSAFSALRSGCAIISDVNMIAAGIAPRRLEAYGNTVHCFISDDDVIEKAKTTGSTRAIVAMQKARDLGLLDNAVVGIGNAPTALLEILRMIENGEAKPALIIGIPVGFVKAEESKNDLVNQNKVEYIASVGRKGGSPLVVSSINALLIGASND